MYSHIWLVYLDGVYPKTYIVTVDGQPYDTITYYRGGKKLTRDEMKSIADGYREWLDFEKTD